MTIDLKPYFDSAQAADEEVQRIMNQMNAAFEKGTEEGKQEALDLRPALDEAKTKAADANTLYISMRDAASASSAAAKQFVPVNDQAAQNPGAGKSLTRDVFTALDAAARMKFIKDGGTLVDPE